MTVALTDALVLDPPVFLAPMAGITDLPYRRVVTRFGAGLVVSEMVACREVLDGRPLARARAELGFGDVASAVQLAGWEAHWLAEAARYCEAEGARIIDINMGCPARKVTNGWSGSALMRDPDHALRLVEAVVAAVEVPVTLKMRLGWADTCRNAPALSARAVSAGVRMITVHGRTRCQFYQGRADWEAIGEVVRSTSVPVIANGDIDSPATAGAALAASGAAGVMVGRAARGRPWLLSEIAARLEGRVPLAPPLGDALADLVIGHYEAMLGFYGEELGRRVARKHLGWYLESAGAEGEARRTILTHDSPGAVISSLRSVLRSAPGPAAASTPPAPLEAARKAA